MHRKKHNHQAPPGWPKGRSKGGLVVAAAIAGGAGGGNPYAGLRFAPLLGPPQTAEYYRRQVAGHEHQQLH